MAWPEGYAFRGLDLEGPSRAEVAREVFWHGFDSDRVRLPGGGRPRPLESENLLEVAVREGSTLCFLGHSLRADPLGFGMRWYDRVQRDDPPGSWEPRFVLARLGSQLRVIRPEEGQRELWVVSLLGGEEGWPEDTAAVLRGFLRRGSPGRSTVLYVGLPTRGDGSFRGTGDGFLVGAQAPGRPRGSLEIEDVAPSLLASLGLPEPAASLGVPRLDLFLPRDVTGACGVLLASYDEAWERQRDLARALGYAAPPRERGFEAGSLLEDGETRQALDGLLANRRRLREAPVRARRAFVEDWRRRHRRRGFWELYTLIVFGGGVGMGGLLLCWRRHSLVAALLGALLGLVVDALLWNWFLANPEGFWVGLCLEPWRRAALGAYTAAIPLVVALGLTLVGWCRRGGVLGSYLLQLSFWLLALAAYVYQFGPLLPDRAGSVEQLFLGTWIAWTLLAATPVFLVGAPLHHFFLWPREHPGEPSRAI